MKVAPMKQALFADRAMLDALCRRYAIRRISLFGSVLKGTARQDSDVDLLVEFAPGQEPGLFKLAGIEAELSALLGGRRVDLRTAQDLSPHFRGEIVNSADEQYAA
jgi:predicted nucleotidyltransferase